MGKIFDVKFMISTVPEIIKYLPVTLRLTVIAAVFALVLGFLIALARYFNIRVLSTICKIYISFIRGTPEMVQLLLAYYGIPIFLKGISQATGWNLSVNGVPPSVFAIIAMALNGAAFMSGTIRSAILSVDKGQLEACYSVNMTTGQALAKVIVPQAFVTALPPLGNSLISMLKGTSLVFYISVMEIMAAARVVGSRSFRFFEVYIVVSLIYWGCCFVLERLLQYVEKKMRKFER